MATPPPQASGRLAGLAVLVVEDEMVLALDYEVLLRREGCRVVGPAPSVEAALRLIGRDAPDVAILDLNLRGTLSTPVAEALGARAIPFVIVSGHTSVAAREPALRDAPRLDKPVSPARLVEALLRLSGRGDPAPDGPRQGGSAAA